MQLLARSILSSLPMRDMTCRSSQPAHSSSGKAGHRQVAPWSSGMKPRAAHVHDERGRADLGDQLDVGEDVQPGGPARPGGVHDPHARGQGAVQDDARQAGHPGPQVAGRPSPHTLTCCRQTWSASALEQDASSSQASQHMGTLGAHRISTASQFGGGNFLRSQSRQVSLQGQSIALRSPLLQVGAGLD